MSLFMIVTFLLLAAGVDDRRLLTRWDSEAKEALHQHARANPALAQAAGAVTELGRKEYLVVASMGMIAFLAVLRLWRLAGIWAAVTLGGFKLVDVLKGFYDRARPEFDDPFVFISSGSFPSGHTADAAMFYGMLAYLVIRATRRIGWFTLPVFALIVALIGFTRIYLGAHWVSDVVGGWILGLGVVALGM